MLSFFASGNKIDSISVFFCGFRSHGRPDPLLRANLLSAFPYACILLVTSVPVELLHMFLSYIHVHGCTCISLWSLGIVHFGGLKVYVAISYMFVNHLVGSSSCREFFLNEVHDTYFFSPLFACLAS